MAVTTEGEDTVDETTAIEAKEAWGTTTWTQTTPETEKTAQATENPEAGGTPGERLETGRTEGCTTAATAGATTTAIMTPEKTATAVWNQEDGRMEPWNTKGDHHFVTTPEAAHRSDETLPQYE